MNNKKCYIYTRVSTTMQVDGYSLEAQKEKLRRYAEFQEFDIAGEYSDEGKSGKSVEGRSEFLRMIEDIESLKDKVSFVLVFKLSRFGRNAADVLTSLQRMQDFGVNLICVEDGIDSSKDSGKLMISVLSAVAEIERENILVQTMEGRKQKAREGKWNGGFAPYGYKLENGNLYIAEDEVEIIRIIYDKYINTNMGANGIADYLNSHGYKKKIRQNNTIEHFIPAFITKVLDNETYCGKIAYGKRKNEKVLGTRNDYHIVKQDNYMLVEGIHEAIINEEDWLIASEKRKLNIGKHERKHDLDHRHLLSSLIKCPVCGAGMYGNSNRKKKPDGTLYTAYYYYACKHRKMVDDKPCTYKKQWNEVKVDDAVSEIIRNLVNNDKFVKSIKGRISSQIDIVELDKELDTLRQQLRQVITSKNKLAQQIDNLDASDRLYDRKYQDMQDRLYSFYDKMEVIELQIEEVQKRIQNVREEKISADNIYQFLIFYDKLFDKFSDEEKKQFLNSFIESIELYPEEQPNGRFIKQIKFKFPIFFEDKQIKEISWDSETTVECVVELCLK
ncbi:MAG: recombinase family protein [Clostridia bacterium]